INGGSTYITDVSSTISEVTVTPGTSMAWSYSTTGGQTLAPIPGYGKVYVASNGNKMIALYSSTGLEVPPDPLATAPVIAFGAVQSYLGWFPVSGGTTEAGGVPAGTRGTSLSPYTTLFRSLELLDHRWPDARADPRLRQGVRRVQRQQDDRALQLDRVGGAAGPFGDGAGDRVRGGPELPRVVPGEWRDHRGGGRR